MCTVFIGLRNNNWADRASRSSWCQICVQRGDISNRLSSHRGEVEKRDISTLETSQRPSKNTPATTRCISFFKQTLLIQNDKSTINDSNPNVSIQQIWEVKTTNWIIFQTKTKTFNNINDQAQKCRYVGVYLFQVLFSCLCWRVIKSPELHCLQS